MTTLSTRREFLRSTSLAAAACAATPVFAAEKPAPFSFILLGDLHLDRLEHHDMDWLRVDKPNDVRQVQDYSRITAEITPRLFATVRETIADLRASAAKPAFVLQVGDLVEGLCGNEGLAMRHNTDALAMIREARFGVPFIFTKGNHDITGPGAPEAFDAVLNPFLAAQDKALDDSATAAGACHAFRTADALFCCFDAYKDASLEWLESQLARRTAEHCFVVIHPPVVPYGARSTWHIYSRDKQKAQREKLLDLLEKNRACVLGGHIHKYNVLARERSAQRRFVQFALSSIISGPEVRAKNTLDGVREYTPDQVNVEPTFSPQTEAERRAVYVAEAPFVKRFEYADLPGYAVVTVDGATVQAQMFSGFSRNVWKTVAL
jgi:UDP-2,3-diacylglucosamine pyrophosphatase LpxH